jgi:mannose-6-phosphate isomerase
MKMIVKLKPVFKDYLWGGEKLRTHYGKATDMMPLAESWELSCHPDGQSKVASGTNSDLTLTEYVEMHPGTLGHKARNFDRFPMLVKFIDAQLDLSVQVHPDDAYGLKVENELGKTEVWYILDAEADAKLIMGFERETNKEEVKEAIKNGNLLDLLHQERVQPGDVFFIESGTVHGIGAGITLIEIQQNSNITYRVYDYDRVGKDGNKRKLDVEKALDVMDFKPSSQPERKGATIASCEYFHAEIHPVNQDSEFQITEDSFQGITCIDGALKCSQGQTTIELIKGESAFITAENNTYTVTGQGQLLVVSIK